MESKLRTLEIFLFDSEFTGVLLQDDMGLIIDAVNLSEYIVKRISESGT